MDDKIKAAFGAVHADEELKSKTKAFIARKTRGYAVRRALNYRRILSAAAVVSVALFLFAGAGLYFTPTAYINIDINPSLELGINRFDKVVSVNPLNDDGKELVKSLDIKFAGYDEAFHKILDNKNVEALLSENEVMTVTVTETNTAQSSKILSEVRACANGYGNVYCHSASTEEVFSAHELGLPCGKYRAFLELQALDCDITPEEIQGMTMREIYELIGSLSGNSGDNANQPTVGGNGHHGNSHGYGHNE